MLDAGRSLYCRFRIANAPLGLGQAFAAEAQSVSLLKRASTERSEVYVPEPIADLFEPNVFPGERVRDAHPLFLPANNIVAFDSLFRMSFATYLVEAVCDIALSLIMYVLLRPVQKDLALLAAFFGLVSTAVFAGAELFYVAGRSSWGALIT